MNSNKKNEESRNFVRLNLKKKKKYNLNEEEEKNKIENNKIDSLLSELKKQSSKIKKCSKKYQFFNRK